jgi:mannose-1-phosphate guanylyltransferase
MTGHTRALVLTAGLGTRLRPLTNLRAKAAMPVAGEPMILRTIRWLTANGVSDIALNLHHLPETIARVVGDGSDLGARVRYSWEQPLVLGAAGGPRHALSIVGPGTFWLINGDTLSDVDFPAIADAHARSGVRVTMALVPNREPHRYGGVRLDPEGRVIGFAARGSAEGTYHFIGVQVVESDVFATLPDGQPAQSIGGLYDDLIASRPGSIRGFVCDATFWDVGTVADYWLTSWSFAAREGQADVTSGRQVKIAPTAHVSRTILWDAVEISRGAVLDECIATDGVCVPVGARYRRAILWRGRDGELQSAPLLL